MSETTDEWKSLVESTYSIVNDDYFRGRGTLDISMAAALRVAGDYRVNPYLKNYRMYKGKINRKPRLNNSVY